MTYSHRFPTIDKAIWNHAGNLDTPKPVHKQKPGRASHAIIPDAVIAKMRYMFEVERKPMNAVFLAFPDRHNSYVRQVLGYIIRPKVKAAP